MRRSHLHAVWTLELFIDSSRCGHRDGRTRTAIVEAYHLLPSLLKSETWNPNIHVALGKCYQASSAIAKSRSQVHHASEVLVFSDQGDVSNSPGMRA